MSSLVCTFQQVPTFLKAFARWGQDTFLNYHDTKKFNLRALIIIGQYSTKDVYFPESMLDRDGKQCPAQDFTKFKKDVLKDLNPDFPETELNLLDAAFKTDVFKNPDMCTSRLNFAKRLTR